MPERILNAIADPIFIKDRAHRVVFVNDAYCKFSGRTREELLNKTAYDFSPKSEADIFHQMDELVFTSGRENVNQEEFTDAGGRVHTIVTKKTLYRKDGQDHIVGVISDVTPLKVAQDDLRRAEGFLDSIIENIPNMIFVKEAKDLRFVSFNKAGEELLGFSRGELVGKNDYDFFPKAEADFFTAKDREVLEGRKPVDIPEEFIQTRQRGKRILHTRKVPIPDSEGKPKYLLGISEDITERKNAEEALQNNELRFMSLVSSVPGAIYRCSNDRDWTVQFLSDAIMEITLYPASDFIGNRVRSYASVIHADDVAAVDEQVQNAVRERRPYTLEYRILRKDGTVRWVYERGQATYGKNNETLWLDGAIFDVTEQKRAADALRLKEALESRSHFLSMVSHELRTPLQSMQEGIAVVLEGLLGKVNEGQRESLAIAQRNVERLTRLINDVLDVQRLDVRDLAYEAEPYDLNEVVADVARTMQGVARRKGVDLKLELASGLPGVRYDRDRLTQVLLNLLNNAVKFTEKGSVTARTVRQDGELVISIRDTGVGIRPEDLPKIFTAFGQLHGRGDGSRGGGLGLVISKKIVEQYGGSLRVISEFGRGSTFSCHFPVEELAS